MFTPYSTSLPVKWEDKHTFHLQLQSILWEMEQGACCIRVALHYVITKPLVHSCLTHLQTCSNILFSFEKHYSRQSARMVDNLIQPGYALQRCAGFLLRAGISLKRKGYWWHLCADWIHRDMKSTWIQFKEKFQFPLETVPLLIATQAKF